MSTTHLEDLELESLLAGDRLPAERLEHLGSCLVCRRRRDTFLATVQVAMGSDPDQAELARVRRQALEAWQAPTAHGWWRWVAAAAAVVVLGLLPVLRGSFRPSPSVDTDAVLEAVDRVLDRDPLAALASEEVLEELVPGDQPDGEGSVS